MTKEAEQGRAVPAVVPGYGEADDEATSMAKAAHDNETRNQTGTAGASEAATAVKVVPDNAGPVGAGTTETDVKGRIAEAAAREASKPAGAG